MPSLSRFTRGAALVFTAVVAAAAAPLRPLRDATLFPAAGATGVCPDTPLRVTLPTAAAVGSAGQIRILDAATGALVESVDVGVKVAVETIGGLPNYRYYPVIVHGRTVSIFPRHGGLQYGHTYDVVVDAGVLMTGDGPCAGIAAADGWRFTTKPAPPAAGTRHLVVAADGSGDFCTIQGALDFIPAGNTVPRTIEIRPGVYTEMVFVTGKNALTLEGDDRTRCILEYATNDTFNHAGGNPYAVHFDPAAEPLVGGHIYHRGVFLAHQVHDLRLANLTIRNTTPRGGSQAEAIILNGDLAAHAVLDHVDLESYQDTLQINGQAYLHDCTIAGDVDFMWGTGPCFFSDCVCRELSSDAFYTQVRNPATNHGFVYVHCRFDGVPGVHGDYLSRVGTGRFPASEVVLLDCTLTAAVNPVGWLLLDGREGNPRDPAAIHFWEYRSHDERGRPVDVRRRMRGSRRLHEPADAALVTAYENPAYVLGGWDPRAAPARAPAAAAAAAP